LRTGKGLTQDVLAERAGLSQKYLGEVERGIGNITVELLGRVADALEIPQASLLEHDHERSLEELQADMTRMIPRLKLKEARIAYMMLRLLADG
jgi:XRE family aerobic/anaerobic benzoate catabolism transcriptional regulator